MLNARGTVRVRVLRVRRRSPMYKDFKFIQTEWQGDFDTGLQVEVKNVSGCTYQSVKVGYKAKSDINYDEIAKYIEKVVFDAKGREFT